MGMRALPDVYAWQLKGLHIRQNPNALKHLLLIANQLTKRQLLLDTLDMPAWKSWLWSAGGVFWLCFNVKNFRVEDFIQSYWIIMK